MAFASQAVPEAPRNPTEMEELCRILGEARRRLRDMNGVLNDKLDRFAPRPTKLGEGNQAGQLVGVVEPQPGTLSALRYFSNELSTELGQLDASICRLGEIL